MITEPASKPSSKSFLLSPFTLFVVAVITVTGTIAATSANTTSSAPPAAPIVSTSQQSEYFVTKFKLVAIRFPPYDVKITLDSDVPDEVMVTLSACRTYKARYQSSNKYEDFPVEYFGEKVPAGELKKGKTYDLDDSKWKSAFIKNLDRSNANTGPQIRPNSISDNVEFSAIVPKNEKLTGPAVIKHNAIKILSADKKLYMPLSDPPSSTPAKKTGVIIGMSEDEVLHSSWGRPEHKNVTVNAYGTSEQWVYRSGNYLYFQNGTLTSIQTH